MNPNRIFAVLNEQRTSGTRSITSLAFRALHIIGLISAMTLASAIAHAQADFEKGYQAFQSYHGSDFDTVNLANGNLVLNIPLLSYEQRGNVPPVTISIRSNSTTFQSTPPLVSGPADTNQHEVASGVIGAPWGQPHVMISPGGLFWKEERIVTSAKTAIGPEYLVRFVAIDDSGATHSLGGGISNSTAGYVPSIKYSVDGSGLMLQPGNAASGPVIVDRKGNTGGLVDPNGNAITLKGPCATTPGSGDYFNAALPSWEAYAHGTISASSITDTIGRVIQNPSYLPTVEDYNCLVDIDASYHSTTLDTFNVCPQVQVGNPASWTPLNYTPVYYVDKKSFPGEGGTPVQVNFCYVQIPVNAALPQVNGANLESEQINETWWVLSSVTLPNGTQWKFHYEENKNEPNYGQVDQVTLPTGAMVTYKYATRLACGNPPGQIPVVGTPIWPYSNILSSRMVTERDVYQNFNDIANGIAPIETWKYSNNVGSGWIGAPISPALLGIASPGGPNSGTVTVTDPLGDVTSHTFSLIGGSTCGPWETKTQYFQGASTLLKEVDTTYSNTGTDYANPTNFSNYIAVGVFPNTVTTALYSNASPLISQDTSQYDTFGSYQDYTGITHRFSFGQVLSSTESDFNSTTPLRTTLHTKQWQSNWNYYARNLIDLPCLDTVMGQGYILPQIPTNPQPSCTPPTAPTTQAAQTNYGYDNPSYTNSAVTWGLPTSVTRWNPTNPINPTTYNYYGTTSSCGPSFLGMPIEKLDANKNATYLCYDSTGLYLNQIIYADNSKEYPTYDKYTGLLTSDTDVNGQTTKYTYDYMRRLTGVTYPIGGGWETLAYNDSPGSLSVNFNKAITSTTMLSKTAYADGLGRLTQTQLTSDPNGTDYTDTTYDSLGRVASVSNPYRTSEPTHGITTYTYDALSRKAIVTAPDGTKKQACFNGISTVGQSNCYSNRLVNVGAWEDDADENGNDWQRIQNALGQMTFVFEPSGLSSSPYMETTYAYDVLNNLLTVNQWGGLDGTSEERAARGFAYDKLSQLLTSSNPETGQSIYTYDANGNVKSKVDARGVTTTYNYDNMNRLLCKGYTGDVNNTPSSWFLYGTSTGFVGRLINAWTLSSSAGVCTTNTTAPSSPPVTGFLTMRTIGSYDLMGRITTEKQSTLANIAGYNLTNLYDLAGDLISSSDGVATTPTGAPISFTSMFDGAGRLQTLTSSWSDITHPAALFVTNPSSTTPSYAPFGGLTNATFGINSAFGNKSAASLNRTYDSRLRITGETDMGGGSNAASGSATVTITGQEQTK